MASISERSADPPLARAADPIAHHAVAFSLLARRERELRLDLFLGLALWLIFIDHVSPDLLTWFTIRSYGFSDAAEIFIFISGYTAAFVYGRAMLESGFVIATARILRRVWQIYAAHVLLFTFLVAEVSYVTISFDKPFYAEEVAITDFFRQPGMSMVQALLLRYRPLNMDVLPLYIVLMAFLPLILLLMRWSANLTLAMSVALYAASWRYDLHLTAYPNGFWSLSFRTVFRSPDLVLPAAEFPYAALARAMDVSHQQDRSGRAQVRTLPGARGCCSAVRAGWLARPGIALAVAHDSVRAKLAGDFLPRGGLGFHGVFRVDGGFRRPRPSRPGRYLRNPDDVRRGMVVFMEQALP
jgi:hypothetical protein